jgi:cytidylate kinase
MFRVLTGAREFGSGGADIARLVADRLHWKLLDNALITGIAEKAKVDPKVCRQFDERVDSWMNRLVRNALRHGPPEAPALVPASAFLDSDTTARITQDLIREAHQLGNCVIVGRGAQCALQREPDVFHVYIYAPWREKVARVRRRFPDVAKPEELIRATDAQRAEYVRVNFGCEWNNPHLYHLLLCSSLGEEAAADVILAAMGSRQPAAAH